MAFRSSTHGIAQSDLLIKAAIEAALQDLRANPWLFDWIFAGAVNDELTNKSYGEKVRDEGRQWFLATKIEVGMADMLDPTRLPAIGIRLLESTEAEVTLGDISPEGEYEEVPSTTIRVAPRIILPATTPTYYDVATGEIRFPSGTVLDPVFPGQVFWCPNSNVGFVIEKVTSQAIWIPAGSQANFVGAMITPKETFLVASLESLSFRETYQISIAAAKDFKHLYFLYSILMFCLLRYKQDYLEARGFERSTIRATDVQSGSSIDHPEVLWGRAIQLTGFVRNYWPKRMNEKLEGISMGGTGVVLGPGGIKIVTGFETPPELLPHARLQGWRMDRDVLGF